MCHVIDPSYCATHKNLSVSRILPQDHHKLLIFILKIHMKAFLIYGSVNILASPTH